MRCKCTYNLSMLSAHINKILNVHAAPIPSQHRVCELCMPLHAFTEMQCAPEIGMHCMCGRLCHAQLRLQLLLAL